LMDYSHNGLFLPSVHFLQNKAKINEGIYKCGGSQK